MYDLQAIETKIDRIEASLSDPDISEDVREEVRESLRDIEYKLDLLRSAQEDILLQVLRDEDVTACECDRYNCPLKHGRVPTIVQYRTDSTLLDALRDYERGHNGAQVVESYRKRKTSMKQSLNEVLDKCLDKIESEL